MLVALLLAFLQPKKISAAVIISEVYPAPQIGSEWIELYNPSNSVATITNWQLFDLLSTPSILYTFDNTEINPLSYLILELPINKLNNSGDGIQLFDDQGMLIDEMTYAFTEQNMSWSRTSSVVTSEFILTAATKNAENSVTENSTDPSVAATPLPTPTVSESSQNLNRYIFISEIMACPEKNSSEWIELYNAHQLDITLTDWRLYDAANNSRAIDGIIPRGGYLVIGWESGILNNNGDSLFLEDNSGATIDTAVYENCETGFSLIKQNNAWVYGSPTPAYENALLQLSQLETTVTNTETGFADTATIDETALNHSQLSAKTSTTKPELHRHQKLQIPILSSSAQDMSSKSAEIAYSYPNNQSSSFSNIPPTSPSKTPILGVILGGILLIASSALFLFPSWQTFLFGEQF